MAQAAELSSAERIRSLQGDDAIFKAFDAYPWTRDQMFMSGLDAILGKPSSQSQSSPTDMATHARIFYYAQRIGVSIDFTRYQSWLAQHPQHQPPQIVPKEFLQRQQQDSHDTPPLAWQQAAPKADLYVDKSAAAATPESSSGEGEPNYPMAFAEMLRLLQEGKPIPGIRQIPNQIARDPSVKPVGPRAVPKKPWEINAQPQSSPSNLVEALDTDFPPLNTDDSSTPS